MQEVPPYPDVAPGLARLREAGVRVAALTNGTARALDAQLRNAGLQDCFECALSAEESGTYKPAAAPYHLAARRLGASPAACRLAAAHAWDLAGARAAGLKTAFVRRPGQALNPAAAPPDRVVDDLKDLALPA